ncbi:transcriptional regulator [Weizmannia acidilactici]|jgi:transcriptional regulator with XRE-family HTH domain|nr:transcriptional regulator [Weizmannia acidilactici]GER74647.1 transcriptional regulator [Weizmannia acidilactici]
METDKRGRRIRAFRKLKGFTQESFARKMGVSVSVLGEVESRTEWPSEALLEKISSVF